MLKKLILLCMFCVPLFFIEMSFTSASSSNEEEQLQLLEEQHQQLSKKKAETELAFKELLNEKETITKNAQQKRKELDELNKQLKIYRNQVTRKNNEIKQFRAKNKALLKGSKAQKNKYNIQLKKLQTQYKKIQTNVTTQKNQILKINAAYSELKLQLATVNENIVTNKNVTATLKNQIQNNIAEKTKLKKYIAEQEAIKNQANKDKIETENVVVTVPPQIEVQPEKFTEHTSVIRSYRFSDDIQYHVLGEGEAFRLVITYMDLVIGGYETEEGKVVGKAVIGQPLNDQLNNLSYMNYHIDKHEGDIVRAVSWWVPTASMKEIVQKARSLTSFDEATNISKLYMELANEFRAKNGKQPLQEHWVLTTAAYEHSKDMAERNYFNHVTPEGLSPSDRVQRVPNNSHLRGAGENIAAGYYDIFYAHTGWINSSGHRTNLLRDYIYIGFGLAPAKNADYSKYYTTKFSSF